jgi:leucyl-tRNA---protein transferase
MFNTYHFPDDLAPKQLDEYLKIGWFRMGQAMFTANHIQFKNILYNTIWLRHDLQNFDAGTTFTKLKNRNKHLQIVLEPFTITPKQEELYQTYLSAMPFAGSPSLLDLLYGFAKTELDDLFTTYQLLLFDGPELVGCTYFDIGNNSAQGISSFYNPAYKTNSLGKYLIYLQIDVCKQNKLAYFYPGYFVPGYPPFDYKLTIAKNHLQFYDAPTNVWLPIQDYYDKAIALDKRFFMER